MNSGFMPGMGGGFGPQQTVGGAHFPMNVGFLVRTLLVVDVKGLRETVLHSQEPGVLVCLVLVRVKFWGGTRM